MTGGACSRFKQNAWKKDLCSNCYKPKEEHQTQQALLPKVYPNLPFIPPSQGILKGDGNKTRGKRKEGVSVSFPKEESEIIGYGGDAESSSSDEEYDDLESSSLRDDEGGGTTGEEEEDEKALKLLTKTNTDFNSVLKNLNSSGGTSGDEKGKATVKPVVVVEPMVRKMEEGVISGMVRCRVMSTKDKPEEKVEEQEEEETKPKEDSGSSRVAPEGSRKTPGITRGNVITKEHVKSKLYIQSKNEVKRVQQGVDLGSGKVSATVVRVEEEDNPAIQQVIVTLPKLSPPLQKKGNEVPVVTLEVLKLLDGEEGPAESREMAGEPDGKADSDGGEGAPATLLLSMTPPTVSSSPPPLNPPPRTSFLHKETTNYQLASSPPSTPCQLVTSSDLEKMLENSDSGSKSDGDSGSSLRLSVVSGDNPELPIVCEPVNRSIKRPAPKPPCRTQEEPCSQAETLLSLVREQEPKQEADGGGSKRNSTGNVITAVNGSGVSSAFEKKKTLKMKTTLRKLLRFGSREDDFGGKEDHNSPHPLPHPRPRPQIIHPLDLNKSGVQVLNSCQVEKSSPGSPPFLLSQTSIVPPVRPNKPPPPPRSESLNLMERLKASGNCDNIYANLDTPIGEARSGMAPTKPQRTGSLREAKKIMQPHAQISDSENVYECVGINSAPECDMEQRSLPYYGSETESDIYYPHISFVNREPKIRQKKRGKNIVLSSLEENYGAVVVANHEALTQLLNQLLLKNKEDLKLIPTCDVNLQWEDFSYNNSSEKLTKINNITFIQASFKNIPLTLVTSFDVKIFEYLECMLHFKGNIPCEFLGVEGKSTLLANVGVLKRMRVEKLVEFGDRIKSHSDGLRDTALVMLQVVRHLMKSEEKISLNKFIIFTEGVDSGPNVFCLPTLDEDKGNWERVEVLREVSMCLLGNEECNPFSEILKKCFYKDYSLEELGWALGNWLWGPPTPTSHSPPLPISALKRWLDLERANALHNLICAMSLSPLEREHLHFLITVDADILVKASKIIHQNLDNKEEPS